MKNTKRLAVIALAAAMLVGCGSNSSSKYDTASYTESAAATSDYYMEYEEAAEWADDAAYSNGSSQAEEVTEASNTNRKLIRTLNIDVETYDFEDLTAAIPARVASLGGYIESSSVDGKKDSNHRYASFTVRVPAAKADEFVELVDGKSNITHQSESVEDVTLSYVDIQSRKESLQIEYDRLQEMLGQAETVEDMIYVEDRLSNVRYEIQSIESQLRTYDNKVDYTTIYLYVSEVKEYTEPEPVDDSVGARIVRGLSNAFKNIGEFSVNFLVVFIVAIPYLIFIAIPVVIVIFIIKAIKKASAKRAEKNGVTKADKKDKKKNKTVPVSYTQAKAEEATTLESASVVTTTEDTKPEE